MIGGPEPDPPLSPEESARVAELTEQDVRSIDEALMAEAALHWRKVARLVGGAMSHEPTIDGIPDVFYAQRVRHLVERGLLKSLGDLRFMGWSHVRLPTHEEG